MNNREVLESIRLGQRYFACAGSHADDLVVFQSVVRQLTDLEQRGLIYGIETKQESYTGHRYVCVVSVDQITDAGIELLNEP